MKQETTNKIAEIFAAQLAAANAKATPKFTGATGAKKAEEPAKPQPQPTPKPAPAQPKQIAPTTPPPAPKQPQPTPAPELSQLTFDDLMKETCSPVTFAITKAAEALQTPAKSNATAPLIVVEYSPKSFAVFGATGEETKAVKDQLAQLGGSYNPRLNYEGGKRQGWIFPNYRRQAVNAALSALQQQVGKATGRESNSITPVI